MSDKMLITTDQVNPIEIFVNGKYDNILEFIRTESEIEEPDVTTGKGRALIKSMAAKVASSKVFIVKGGKDLADAEKKKIADTVEKMNTSKKFIEDCLVYRKAEVREPLTKWEEKEKEKEEAAALELKKQNDHTEAIEHNKFLDDKKANEETAAQLDKERIQLDADTKAIKNAGSIGSEAINSAVKSQGAAEAEVIRLKKEKDDQAAQAIIDQDKAVEAERLRIQLAADKVKKEEEARAADKVHRRKINREALEDLTKILVGKFSLTNPDKICQQIIIAVVEKQIRNISIKY